MRFEDDDAFIISPHQKGSVPSSQSVLPPPDNRVPAYVRRGMKIAELDFREPVEPCDTDPKMIDQK